MKNNNIFQKIGFAIIIISFALKLVNNFFDTSNFSEYLTNPPLIAFSGIGIWLIGSLKHWYDKKNSASS